ncbi:mechanosensitive ion channel [Erythrobacter sp. sf7]|uniref:Mechanosensitive ion channel n=1 Tax=Erythrobacter fulvus TaxID=2987523 RepID=A0ABT5JNB8_9SPHN|nr:mechanosensitive ion channel domain-containing protein [Erythrobacter fulvus]MDC8754149.1 mechanosensitive ion channel [Erythrobacter fulvus]
MNILAAAAQAVVTDSETPPADGASAAPADATPAPTPLPEPSATPTVEVVEAADKLKEGVTAQSKTAGAFLERLDAIAVQVGHIRISLFDALLVVGVILLVITAAMVINRIGKRAIRKVGRFDETQKLLAEKLLTIVVWAAAFFIGIDLLGIDLTALAFFGGAFGLAIGFGLQKTFGNLIAGIILLMDKSIKPGDVIAVTDMAGNETFGQIRKIGIRAVSVTTRDEREYLIPNENLMINQVENWSYSSKKVRMQVHVGISYNADMNLAEELMLEAAKKAPRVLDTPPPTVWMSEYGDNSVNFTIHCWIVDPEEGVGNVRSTVLKNLWWLFKEHGIEIPFPQRDINLRGNAQFEALIAALEGDRAAKE